MTTTTTHTTRRKLRRRAALIAAAGASLLLASALLAASASWAGTRQCPPPPPLGPQRISYAAYSAAITPAWGDGSAKLVVKLTANTKVKDPSADFACASRDADEDVALWERSPVEVRRDGMRLLVVRHPVWRLGASSVDAFPDSCAPAGYVCFSDDLSLTIRLPRAAQGWHEYVVSNLAVGALPSTGVWDYDPGTRVGR